MTMLIMDGNQAAAWGAYFAGCRFFAGYPLTPATSIYNTMLDLLPKSGGVVVQAEDEIASIGMCLGASMAGNKAMTATSGPGLSLFSENLSFAVGSEIPLVIVNVQRQGPSTGSATRGADGDIQFMRWGNSGGMPLIVLCPVNAPDCLALTMQAFNLAETYRCPVIVASNKEVGLTEESIDFDAIEKPDVIGRRAPMSGGEIFPFTPLPGADVPGFLPIGHETLVRNTSSTHGEKGYIITEPDDIQNMISRMDRKIEAHVDEFTFYEHHDEPGADTLMITYGVTSRAALEAIKKLKAGGRAVSHLILKTLWPVPANTILKAAAGKKRVVMAEMNMGQYVREIERVVKGVSIDFLGQMNGKLISPEQIAALIEK